MNTAIKEIDLRVIKRWLRKGYLTQREGNIAMESGLFTVIPMSTRDIMQSYDGKIMLQWTWATQTWFVVYR